ncbi:hypothetical protein Tco_1420001 [Tanacetum coccineum]
MLGRRRLEVNEKAYSRKTSNAEVQENEVFQDMQLIQKLRDDQKCMKKVEHSSRSKATKDIINIGSFMEVLVLVLYGYSLPSLKKPYPQGSRRDTCRGCGFCEEMRILLSELIFTFPCELRTSPRVPSNLDNGNTALLQPLDFTIHDL